jgi:hypothetical protein
MHSNKPEVKALCLNALTELAYVAAADAVAAAAAALPDQRLRFAPAVRQAKAVLDYEKDKKLCK